MNLMQNLQLTLNMKTHYENSNKDHEEDKEKRMKALPTSAARQLSSAQVITSVVSVVKELLENSVDSGATAIDIKLENYGFDKIEVRDNGSGIDSRDVAYMALRHYTSKIDSMGDLKTLETYGFRGEALGSLCSVADVSITTKTASDHVSQTYTLDHQGNITGTKLSHRPQGTTVVACQLFKNLPVRRNYYNTDKKKREELKRVEDLLLVFGIICYGGRFMLQHGRDIIFQKSAANSVRDALLRVFGRNVMTDMTHCQHTQSQVEMDAYLPKPSADSNSTSRVTNDRTFICVNHRPVILKDVENLVRSYYCRRVNCEAARYPIMFLQINLPPRGVDVNLDPNKTRVFLHDQPLIIDTLRHILEEIYGLSEISRLQDMEPAPTLTASPKQDKFQNNHVDSPNFETTDQSNTAIKSAETKIKFHELNITEPFSDAKVSSLSDYKDFMEKKTISPVSASQIPCFELLEDDDFIFPPTPVVTPDRVNKNKVEPNANLPNICGDMNEIKKNSAMSCKEVVMQDRVTENKDLQISVNGEVIFIEQKKLPEETKELEEWSGKTTYKCPSKSDYQTQPTQGLLQPCTGPLSEDSQRLPNIQGYKRLPDPRTGSDSDNNLMSADVTIQIPVYTGNSWRPAGPEASQNQDNPGIKQRPSDPANSQDSAIKLNNQRLSGCEDNQNPDDASIGLIGWSRGDALQSPDGRIVQPSKLLVPLPPKSDFNSPSYKHDLLRSTPKISKLKSAASSPGQVTLHHVLKSQSTSRSNIDSTFSEKQSCAGQTGQEHSMTFQACRQGRNQGSSECTTGSLVTAAKKRRLNLQSTSPATESPQTLSKQPSIVIPFSNTRLKEILKKDPRNLSMKNKVLIGQLNSHNAWIGFHGEQIVLVLPWRLQEMLIFTRLMENHCLNTQVLDQPIVLQPGLVGGESAWEALLGMRKSHFELPDPHVYYNDPRLVKNGFSIRHLPDVEAGVRPEVCAMAQTMNYFGLSDLQEVLDVISNNPDARLTDTRPVKIRHYLQGEAVRMSRALPAVTSKADILDLLIQAEKYLPPDVSTCFHKKPFLLPLYNMEELPATQTSREFSH